MTRRVTGTSAAGCCLAAALLAIVLAPDPAAAHGNTIDLDDWCRAVNDRGGIKLPTDPKWKARYSYPKKRWECARPESYGFGKISPAVVQPLDLATACGKRGGSRKVHFHEGTSPASPDSVHCGLHDGTVKRSSGQATTLRMCNNSSYPWVAAAYAFWDRRPGQVGWTSDGWWTIDRGECQQVTVHGGPSGNAYTGDVYVYGEHNTVSWGGSDAKFCVQDRSFTFTTSDEMNCSGGTRKKVGMDKYTVQPGTNTWNFR
jgi:uncharacterized membrane protein